MSDTPISMVPEEKKRRWKVHKKLWLLYCGKANRSCSDDSYVTRSLISTTSMRSPADDTIMCYKLTNRESVPKMKAVENHGRSSLACSSSTVAEDHVGQSPRAPHMCGISVFNRSTASQSKLKEQEHRQAQIISDAINHDTPIRFAYCKDGKFTVSTRTISARKRSLMMKILLDDSSLLSDSDQSKLENSSQGQFTRNDSSGASCTSTSTESKHSFDPPSYGSHYRRFDRENFFADTMMGREVEVKCAPTICALVSPKSGSQQLRRLDSLNGGITKYGEEKCKEINADKNKKVTDKNKKYQNRGSFVVKDGHRSLLAEVDRIEEIEPETKTSGFVSTFSDLGDILFETLGLGSEDDSATASYVSEFDCASGNVALSVESGHEADQLTTTESLATFDDTSSEEKSQICMILTTRRMQDQQPTSMLFAVDNEQTKNSTQISMSETEVSNLFVEGIEIVRNSDLSVASFEIHSQDIEAHTEFQTRDSIWMRLTEDIELSPCPLSNFIFSVDGNTRRSEETATPMGYSNAEAWLSVVKTLKLESKTA